MFKYVARRLLQMIPVFLGVTLLLFVLRAPGVLPGDPVRMITGERAISEQLRAQVIKEHALDQPLHVQYWIYLTNLAQGDLGESFQRGRPVVDIFAEKFPNTLRLALAAIFIELIVGVAAGIISAIKRYSFWDVFVTLSTSVLVSVPVFWLGMLLQILFGIQMKEWTSGAFFLPISQMSSAQFPDWAHLILPAITLIMDNFLYPLFKSGSSDNFAGYTNPEVDRMLEQARKTVDDAERIALYQEIEAAIGADMPVIPLMYYSHTRVASERVRDGVMSPKGLFAFESVWLAQ